MTLACVAWGVAAADESPWPCGPPRLGAVEDAVGEVLPADEDAVQVALGAAVGNVAPHLGRFQLPQPREPVEHPDLELPGVDACVSGDGISSEAAPPAGQAQAPSLRPHRSWTR